MPFPTTCTYTADPSGAVACKEVATLSSKTVLLLPVLEEDEAKVHSSSLCLERTKTRHAGTAAAAAAAAASEAIVS